MAFDEDRMRLTGLGGVDLVKAERMIQFKVFELARKAALPVRKVSVEELYRRAAAELLRSQQTAGTR